MTRAPRLSRSAMWLLIAAMLVTLAELGWWTWFNLRNTARERRDHLARIEAQITLADGLQKVLAAEGQQAGLAPEAAQARANRLLAAHFPELSFAHGEVTAAQVGIALDIERNFVTHVRMFVAEGGVFALMLLLGGYLVVRSLRHELAIVRQNNNFVAAITHELKSPLASLRLWVETLERHPPSPAELMPSLQIMQADIERLDTLIGNVLTAARLEGSHPGEAMPRRSTGALDAAAKASAIVASLGPRALSLKLTLRLRREGSAAACIDMAPSAFELVLRNLLDNALKYSAGAGHIDVALAASDGQLTVGVTDYGIGLAKADLERIFQKFYRVGDEMVRRSQGTGLGLFLVRAVVQEHGGSVQASSEGLGHGATFQICLPLAAGAADPSHAEGVG